MNNEQAVAVVEKLGQLKAANKAGKRELLREFLEDPYFVKVLKYTLDTSKTYHVSRVAKTEPIYEDVFDCLDVLNSQSGAKARDKTYLAGIASQSEHHLDLVNRILRGRLDAGFDIKTVQEVSPGLIPYSPYCRCSGYDQIGKLKLGNGTPVFSQLKADGMFLNIHIEEGKIRYTTRKGNELNLLGAPDHMFANARVGDVLMGEALVLADKEGYLPRAEGNAIISKAIDNGISPYEADRIVFFLWDCVSAESFANGESPMPYHERFFLVKQTVENSHGLFLIDCKEVNNLDEAMDHYEEVRAKGMEGTILKSPAALWSDGTSMMQVKLKAEKEAEVEVIGTAAGSPGGKYENAIGSLIVKSACGKLIGNVSGLTDEQRNMDPDYFIGKIVTVRFNAVSKSAKTDIRSFDHARLIEVRLDKREADDLEYILNVKETKKR